MFKAKMVMTRDPVTVRVDTPINEAIDLLADNNITGLPVVDEANELVGIISEKDLLRLLYETSQQGGLVADFMTTTVKTFDEQADLTDVCECLINNSFRRVPILADGRLAGVISRSDIIKFIRNVRSGGKS